MTTSARYGAFISYSHAASAEVSRGLEKWLQNYAKPWWRWRAINVFRDETNLTAAPALWSRIALALDQSSHFVLLASPEAAKSKWIKREVRYWLGDPNAAALGDADLDAPMANPRAERVATLLIALTAGEILWDEKAGDARAGDFNWHTTNALPRVLSGVFKEEFQWVDLRTTVQKQELRNSLSRRNSEFMLAVAQLAAPIRGIADFSRLVSEDYRQYRRTIRAAWAAAAVLAWVSAAALSNATVPCMRKAPPAKRMQKPRRTPSRQERTPRRRKPTCLPLSSGSRGSWPTRRASSGRLIQGPRLWLRLRRCRMPPLETTVPTSRRRSCNSTVPCATCASSSY
jgi:MTH538 TIR-like domain (DUF1863)